MDKKETQYAHFDLQILANKKSWIVSSEEALKDVIPIDWGSEVLEGKKKVLVTNVRDRGRYHE